MQISISLRCLYSDNLEESLLQNGMRPIGTKATCENLRATRLNLLPKILSFVGLLVVSQEHICKDVEVKFINRLKRRQHHKCKKILVNVV